MIDLTRKQYIDLLRSHNDVTSFPALFDLHSTISDFPPGSHRWMTCWELKPTCTMRVESNTWNKGEPDERNEYTLIVAPREKE